MKLPRAIVNCEQIVTVSSNGDLLRVGPEQDRVDLIERRTSDNVGCSIVFGAQGQIVAVGHDDRVREELKTKYAANTEDIEDVIDGKGCSLIPGLIDAHSHPVWAGDRVNEFDMKLRGATYLEIHNKGGGIHFTVEHTKRATEDQLLKDFLERVQQMVTCGTTVLECKTGYGMDFETELKMLRVIKRARPLTNADLVTTFLGAHSVPKEMTSDEGVAHTIETMNKISNLKEAKELAIEFVDVFCERGL